MDWQIRLSILIAGIILVGYIYWDFAKKKKVQKANDQLKRQFGSISDQVDSSGFDFNGVGKARVSSESSDSSGETIDHFISNSDSKSEITGKTSTQFEQQKPEQIAQPKQSKVLKDVPVKGPNQSTSNSTDLFEGSVPDSPEPDISLSEEPELVFSLIIQANKESQFNGQDILPIFLSQGLRHGEMGIFHRHHKTGSNPGPVLFSLANAIAPGTFNIDAMNDFKTPALALFMTLPGPVDAQIAYSAMVKTARLIVKELGGIILDESQSDYSEQTHNHRLDQIQEYNRKRLS